MRLGQIFLLTVSAILYLVVKYYSCTASTVDFNWWILDWHVAHSYTVTSIMPHIRIIMIIIIIIVAN